MTIKGLWAGVGALAVALFGWTGTAEASTCHSSTECSGSTPICVGGSILTTGSCKPCDGLLAILSCTASSHPTYVCSTSGDTKGACVAPGSVDIGIGVGIGVGVSSSSGSIGVDAGVGVGVGVSSSSGGIGVDAGVGVGVGVGVSSSSGGTSNDWDCTIDAHCGEPASGRICDLATKKCTAGCRVGGNDCKPGNFCTAHEVHEVGTCAAPGSGSAGHTGGTCAQDADCGEVLSGVICGEAKKCEAGCRPSGGNTCGVGFDCSLPTGESAGICVALPSSSSSSSSGGVSSSSGGASSSGGVPGSSSGFEIPTFHDAGTTTTFPASRVPVLSASTDTNANVTASKDGNALAAGTGNAADANSDLEGGGCNVTNTDDRSASASLVGLVLGFAALVRSRRKRA